MEKFSGKAKTLAVISGKLNFKGLENTIYIFLLQILSKKSILGGGGLILFFEIPNSAPFKF